MCEFCEGNKLLFQQGDDDYDHCYIGITSSMITINAHFEGLIGTEDNFKINYCPKCGRNLNVKNY